MAKFKVGDHVERIGTLVPPDMRSGGIIRVIPDKSGTDWLNEYEIDFGNDKIAKFYEPQLRLVQVRRGTTTETMH
jgi:hypothetical protein